MRATNRMLALCTFVIATCCGGWLYAEQKSAEPASPAGKSPGMVQRIKVVTDKAPDCSSLKSIVQTVTRGCKTNDDKAIAIYNFMRLAHYHHAYPREKGGIGALKLINVYGWSLCGGLHTVEAALWREMGWPWRYVGWSKPGHTTVEAKYDGQWHYLDVFLKFYVWKPAPDMPRGRTIANQADIKANPALVTEGLVFDKARRVYYHKDDPTELPGGKPNWLRPAFLVCGDTVEGIITGVNHNRNAGSPTAWNAIKFDSPGYSTDVNLGPGYSLTVTWDAIKGAHWWRGHKKPPYHTCGNKDYRNCPSIGPILEPYATSGGRRRSYANGKLIFAPDFANDAFLSVLAAKENVKWQPGELVPADSSKPASITVQLQSPYVMTRASGVVEGADKVEISVDGGKTYKPIEVKDFSEAVAGHYKGLVRITFSSALKALRLDAIVQCNRCSLPYLAPGKNKVTVSVADPAQLGDNRLVVTYAYRLGWRDRSYEQLCKKGEQMFQGKYASWSETPTVVQKVFTAKDLPATFEIDIPTPKGKYPAYPRMLFLRREVLAPGSKPMPLPKGAVEPKMGSNDTLKTLPNPFLVGTSRLVEWASRADVVR